MPDERLGMRTGVISVGPAALPMRLVPEFAAAIAYRRSGPGVELLLVRSSSGKWTFPKGKVDSGETPAHAAAREALEEAGVTGDVAEEPLTTYRHLKRLNSGRSISIVVAAFPMEVRTKREPGELHRAPVWFTADDARRALAVGRSPMYVAELGRVIDETVRAVGGVAA